VPVQLDLNRDELDTLNAHKLELPGVDWPAVPHRNYRTGTVLPHVVGYMNEITQEELDRLNGQGEGYALGDFIGRARVERYFERRLRGKDGSRKEVVNARGETIQELSELITGEATVASTPGDNVVLSIDMRLQAAAEKAFLRHRRRRRGDGRPLGLHPGDGVRARVRPQRPHRTGDAGAAGRAEQGPAPADDLPSGAAALQPGLDLQDPEHVRRAGEQELHPPQHRELRWRVPARRRMWRCHKDAGHGLVDARRALQQSCDTWFYKVADTLGLDPIATTARSFGFGRSDRHRRRGRGAGHHAGQRVPRPRHPGGYTKGMALNSVIGQGDVNVTPLQLTMAYAAVANGGHLYKPQLVRRLETPDGRTLQEFQPEVVRELDLDPDARRLVVDALAAVVNESGGTAYRARLPDVHIAGKTGTAQVIALGKTRAEEGGDDLLAA
jgi:penicillin-binding protein 2